MDDRFRAGAPAGCGPAGAFFCWAYGGFLTVRSRFAWTQPPPADFLWISTDGYPSLFSYPMKSSFLRPLKARNAGVLAHARERLTKVYISLVLIRARMSSFIRFLRSSRVLKAGLFYGLRFLRSWRGNEGRNPFVRLLFRSASGGAAGAPFHRAFEARFSLFALCSISFLGPRKSRHAGFGPSFFNASRNAGSRQAISY